MSGRVKLLPNGGVSNPMPLFASASSSKLGRLLKEYSHAQKAWNDDGGPVEKTVQAGEALYFAADALIDHLIALNSGAAPCGTNPEGEYNSLASFIGDAVPAKQGGAQ